FLTDRMREGNVGDDAATEKAVVKGSLGPIDELIDEDDVARFVSALESADSADAENPFHAETSECPDVGAVVQFARQDAVTAAMAGKEDDLAAFQSAGQEVTGRISERSFDFDPLGVDEAFDVVQAAPADNANPAHVLERLEAEAGEFVLEFGLELSDVALR